MSVRTIFHDPSTGLLRSGWRIPLMVLCILPILVGLTFASRRLPASLPMAWALAAKAAIGATGILGMLGVHRLFARWVERRKPVEVGGGTGFLRSASLGLLLGAGPMLVIAGILAACGSYRVVGTNGAVVALRALIFYLPQSFIEDFFFCLVLYRLIREGLGARAALLIAPALFAAAHLGNSHESVLGITEIVTGGILMYSLFERTGSFWTVWALHFGWNFTMNGVLGMANSGQATKGFLNAAVTGPAWLTGGATGPEASVLAVGLDLLLILLVWRAPASRIRLQPEPEGAWA